MVNPTIEQSHQVPQVTPRTGIDNKDPRFSSETVNTNEGVVGKLRQFARRVLARTNTQRPHDKGF